MNRLDRLFALILVLQSRRVVTAEQLADHFELSIRTIYRDLAALGQAGVPILAEAGVGYSLMRGYHLPPVNFTPEEARALIMGGLLVDHFTDPSTTSQMRSALLKLRAILPEEQREQVGRIEAGMTATASVRPDSQADLVMLQQALAQRNVLRFAYRGASGRETSTRTVHPLGLIYYLERWHLIAWCQKRNDFRDFRTDRMVDIELLRATFSPPPDFSLAKYIRESMPAPSLHARIRFDATVADRAKREWWQGVTNEEVSDEGVSLTLQVVEWPRLVGWLLSFGPKVTVIEPEDLRRQLVEAAGELAAHHRCAGE